jgi:hypothetical protein
MRECAFLLATFGLRSAWTNWHNSRQCCNLDELINQSELTRDLAPTQGTRVVEKLASIAADVFDEPKERKDLHCDLKEFRGGFKVIPM